MTDQNPTAKTDKVKSMSKSEIAATLAEKVGITKKQALAFFNAQAELAYSQAGNTFAIPGIGKLVLTQTKAREQMMQFGPNKGKMMPVAAKTKVKFKLAKAAKDAVLKTK